MLKIDGRGIRMGMNIRLREREEGKLSEVKGSDTFKLPESSFIFMKIDVEGLNTLPKKAPDAKENPKPIKVRIPEGKVPVSCLNTGKTRFLDVNEKVQIVELEVKEVIREKEVVKEKGK